MKLETAAGHAAEVIRSLPPGGRVRVVSHNDADGLAAASITALALHRAGYGFHLTIKQTSPRLTQGMEKEENRVVIWCDLGSSNLEELTALPGTAILCDHHIMQGELTDGINLNVRSYGLDGSTEACGASAALALALALDEHNLDLAELAIAGAIGDKQDRDGFSGYNRSILERAVEAGHITLEERPAFNPATSLMDALEESIEPFFTGFAGDGALQFLKKLDIDSLKSFDDLSPQEQKKLLSALALHLVEQQADEIALMQTVPAGKRFGPLYDLASKLNACAREGNNGVGIALCLGSPGALEKAQELQQGYRAAIRHEMRALEKEQPQELSHLTYFYLKNGSLKGVCAGLSMTYLPAFDIHKPVIALTDDGDTIGVSGRGTPSLVEKGLDLAAGMQQAAAEVGGTGGGHPIAAGADIPAGRDKTFLQALNKVLSQQ
ncbi:MAG: DHH family phosphoesterase [Candidatus Thermoplasmatota archaeon]|nr:DHH family phosphoesterase [Candidatus Thermoplasmatota archaeon]